MIFRGSNGSFRSSVAARDHGVCSECGLDTIALAERYAEAERLDLEAARGTFRCLDEECQHIGTTRPCEACGSRFQETVAVHDNRALVVAEATRSGFKSIDFITTVKAKRSLWIADHVVPLADGGDNTLENGRTLCIPCNARITARQAKARGAARRKARKPHNEARAIVRAMRGIR